MLKEYLWSFWRYWSLVSKLCITPDNYFEHLKQVFQYISWWFSVKTKYLLQYSFKSYGVSFQNENTEVRSASLGEAECISLFLFSSNVYSQSGGGWKLKDKEMLMESSMQCILYSYDRLNQSKFSPPWIFHLIYENLYFSANIKFCKIPYDLKTDIL